MPVVGGVVKDNFKVIPAYRAEKGDQRQIGCQPFFIVLHASSFLFVVLYCIRMQGFYKAEIFKRFLLTDFKMIIYS